MKIRRIVWIFGALALACAAWAPQISAAVDAFLTITGQKQGMIAGAGQTKITDFSYSTSDASAPTQGKLPGKMATAPRDANTGAPSGRRMHSVITIQKEVDAASPKLMKAMTGGETLTSVDLQFTHTGPKGPEVYKSLHLTNATITNIRTVPLGGGKSDEIITIIADTQDVQMKSKDGGIMATDDWLSK